MRLKKLWITIILICFGIFFFAGCEEETFAQSVSLNGYSAETPLEVAYGKFSCNGYTVSIKYEDGTSEETPLTEDMISETDKLKFYQAGKNEITISYKGASTVVAINVLRNEFSDKVKLNPFTATYTGEPFTVEVEGDLPGGTKILYPQGNTFENAGSYDMTAIVQCDGYVSKTLSARIVIEKATYDVTNAQLYDDEAVYNQDAHSLVLKGKTFKDENGAELHEVASLPTGVSVSYTITKIKDGKGNEIAVEKQQTIEGNKAIDAGTYKVCARFKGDASNYAIIPDSVAYLTVKRASYDMSGVNFENETVTYSGEKHSLSIAKGSKMPIDVQASYQIKQVQNGFGDTVTEEYKAGNQAVDAGKYSVKVSFNVTGKNADNYMTSPMEKQAYLTIERAVFDISNVDFFNTTVRYSGEPYEVSITSELPKEIGVSYQIKRVRNGNGQKIPNSEYIDGCSAVDAGEYTVKAVFEILDINIAKNYTTNPLEKEVEFTILRASYDEELQNVHLTRQYTFEETEEHSYTLLWSAELPEGVSPVFTLMNNAGETIQCEVKITEENGTAVYQCVFSTETVGEYTCWVTFTHENDNYETITLQLETRVYINSKA